VRTRVAVLVLVLGLAGAVAVVGLAQSSNGLPAYTKGYAKWPKLNRKPVTGGSAAHSGVKNTYASKPQSERANRFPNGTVIVKSIAKAGDKASLPGDVAVMRKVNGRWRYVEYRLSGSRYAVLAQGRLCQNCHAQARANDYVFTKR
jgi:hypothetical protein